VVAVTTFSSAQVDELCELYYDLGFEAGRLAEAKRIGEAHADLEAVWVEQGRKTRAERLGARLASMAPKDPDWLATSAERLRQRENRARPWWATDPNFRWPEPYASRDNGMTLGVAERQLFGELGRAA
jgi:hypothetical protein